MLIFITTACKIFTVVNAQTFLDFKFGPLVKLTRLFISDIIRPTTFDAGYRESLKNNVSSIERLKVVTQDIKFPESSA